MTVDATSVAPLLFVVTRRGDGDWVALARSLASGRTVTQPVRGWSDVIELRNRWSANEWFSSDLYPVFVAEFGPAPAAG